MALMALELPMTLYPRNSRYSTVAHCTYKKHNLLFVLNICLIFVFGDYAEAPNLLHLQTCNGNFKIVWEKILGER